jgi:hypothetical protein
VPGTGEFVDLLQQPLPKLIAVHSSHCMPATRLPRGVSVTSPEIIRVQVKVVAHTAPSMNLPAVFSQALLMVARNNRRSSSSRKIASLLTPQFIT